MRHRLTRTLAPAMLVAVLALGACSDDADKTEEEHPSGHESSSQTSPSETPTEEPSETETSPSTAPEPEADVTLKLEGGVWDPNGIRIDAKIGEPVVIAIDADTAGELHVHSTPEQEIAFSEGASVHEVTIESPGVVEVESHDPTAVVVQLEVR